MFGVFLIPSLEAPKVFVCPNPYSNLDPARFRLEDRKENGRKKVCYSIPVEYLKVKIKGSEKTL